MELKVSETEAINKFIDQTIIAYKDKGKTPDKLFYEIWGADGKRIGAARKGLTLEGIQKEFIALGEGKYFLQDAELKVEITVSDEDSKKTPEKKVSSSKNSSKTINNEEAKMSDETRGMMDVMKDNGKDAMGKVFHGAKVKAANKAVDTLLLKLYAKSGRNELLGSALNDEAARALLKIVIAFAASTVANEKQFAGSEHIKTVSGLIMEGSGGELVEPLMDLLLPLVGELVSAGKEISEMDLTKLPAKEEEVFDAEKEAEALREHKRKAEKAKEAQA